MLCFLETQIERKYATKIKIIVPSERAQSVLKRHLTLQCRSAQNHLHRKQDGWDCGMHVCIFPCYVPSFNLIFLLVSCRDSSKGIQRCPVATSDLVLIHNCAQQALAMPNSQVNSSNFNVWSLCATLESPYKLWSRAHKKRVANMLADERILPDSPDEEI